MIGSNDNGAGSGVLPLNRLKGSERAPEAQVAQELRQQRGRERTLRMETEDARDAVRLPLKPEENAS